MGLLLLLQSRGRNRGSGSGPRKGAAVGLIRAGVWHEVSLRSANAGRIVVIFLTLLVQRPRVLGGPISSFNVVADRLVDGLAHLN